MESVRGKKKEKTINYNGVPGPAGGRKTNGSSNQRRHTGAEEKETLNLKLLE